MKKIRVRLVAEHLFTLHSIPDSLDVDDCEIDDLVNDYLENEIIDDAYWTVDSYWEVNE